MSGVLRLSETRHPNEAAASAYDGLVGIDQIKETLLDELGLMLSPRQIKEWEERHHQGGLPALLGLLHKAPLIVLSGDVGCGKTALATCVATPVAKRIGERIIAMESPSDIRGGGLVGELSQRIAAVFACATQKADELGRGILIIDEADDLVSGRDQIQAHHEDRAGVNVLIKEVDKLTASKSPMAVILITNRLKVFDAAVSRRASLFLKFERPNAAARAALFKRMLRGTDVSDRQIAALVAQTETASGYTYSDLAVRAGRAAIRRAWKKDVAFDSEALKEAFSEISPSPSVQEGD